MIEDARNERKLAALMQEAVDCLPTGFVPTLIGQRDLLAGGRLVGRARQAGPAAWGQGHRSRTGCAVRASAHAVPPPPRTDAARVSQKDLNSLFSTMDVPRKAAA